MQFAGNVNGQPIKVLIDGSSTLSLISESLYTTPKPSFLEQPLIIIRLPNGHTLTSHLRRPEFRWSWGQQIFTTEVWVVALKDWDDILGTNWLS